MTIPKNTRKAKEILANAHAVLCYSLAENFIAKPLADKPVVWADSVNNSRNLIEVSTFEFLMRELESRHAKLTLEIGGEYIIHVHSNLWYTFAA